MTSPSPVLQSPSPLAVALVGLPGAGKSLVAAALGERLGLRRLDRDAIRHALFPHCSYSFIEKHAAFRALLLGLEINGILGESSVIDGCTFSRRAELDRVEEVTRRQGQRFVALFLDCPPDLARERIRADVAASTHLARDRDPDLVAEVVARFEPPPSTALRIDASRPADEVCRLACEAVAALGSVAPGI